MDDNTHESLPLSQSRLILLENTINTSPSVLCSSSTDAGLGTGKVTELNGETDASTGMCGDGVDSDQFSSNPLACDFTSVPEHGSCAGDSVPAATVTPRLQPEPPPSSLSPSFSPTSSQSLSLSSPTSSTSLSSAHTSPAFSPHSPHSLYSAAASPSPPSASILPVSPITHRIAPLYLPPQASPQHSPAQVSAVQHTHPPSPLHPRCPPCSRASRSLYTPSAAHSPPASRYQLSSASNSSARAQPCHDPHEPSLTPSLVLSSLSSLSVTSSPALPHKLSVACVRRDLPSLQHALQMVVRAADIAITHCNSMHKHNEECGDSVRIEAKSDCDGYTHGRSGEGSSGSGIVCSEAGTGISATVDTNVACHDAPCTSTNASTNSNTTTRTSGTERASACGNLPRSTAKPQAGASPAAATVSGNAARDRRPVYLPKPRHTCSTALGALTRMCEHAFLLSCREGWLVALQRIWRVWRYLHALAPVGMPTSTSLQIGVSARLPATAPVPTSPAVPAPVPAAAAAKAPMSSPAAVSAVIPAPMTIPMPATLHPTRVPAVDITRSAAVSAVAIGTSNEHATGTSADAMCGAIIPNLTPISMHDGISANIGSDVQRSVGLDVGANIQATNTTCSVDAFSTPLLFSSHSEDSSPFASPSLLSPRTSLFLNRALAAACLGSSAETVQLLLRVRAHPDGSVYTGDDLRCISGGGGGGGAARDDVDLPNGIGIGIDGDVGAGTGTGTGTSACHGFPNAATSASSLSHLAPLTSTSTYTYTSTSTSASVRTTIPASVTPPLMIVSARGNLPLVELLLRSRARVDARDSEGETALMRATLHRHHSVVRALLAARANVEVRSEGGVSAVLLAVCNQDCACLELLLRERRRMRAQETMTDKLEREKLELEGQGVIARQQESMSDNPNTDGGQMEEKQRIKGDGGACVRKEGEKQKRRKENIQEHRDWFFPSKSFPNTGMYPKKLFFRDPAFTPKMDFPRWPNCLWFMGMNDITLLMHAARSPSHDILLLLLREMSEECGIETIC